MAHEYADPKRAGRQRGGSRPDSDVHAKSVGRPVLLVGFLLAAAVGVAVMFALTRATPNASDSAAAPVLQAAEQSSEPPSAKAETNTAQGAASDRPAPSGATAPPSIMPTGGEQADASQKSASPPTTAQAGASGSNAGISRQLRAYLKPFIADAESAPDDADKQARLGLVYAGNRMWGKALTYFQRAGTLDPKNYLLAYYQGIASAKTGDLKRAIEFFYETVELNDEFAPAYHRLGDALLATGAVEEAESAFRETLAVSPMAAQAYMGLAEVMLSLGDYAEAVKNADTALALHPGDPTAHYLLGLAYRGEGRRDLAKHHLRLGAKNRKPYLTDPWSAALAAHCKIVDDQAARAMAKVRGGAVEEGIADLEALLEWYPDMISLRNTLASVYRFAGAPEKSLALLEESIKIDPTAPATYVELATHFLDGGNLNQALQTADKAIQKDPEAYRAHAVRGRILYKMGRDQEALAAWEQAIEIHPASPRVLLRAGLLSKQMGGLDKAKEYLERSIEHDPSAPLAYVALGEVHLLQGDLGAAAQIEEEARELFPEHPKVILLGESVERAIQRAEN
ncbi:MAG: tetratricopeptide repeat protein [Phycisphaerae bacterium]